MAQNNSGLGSQAGGTLSQAPKGIANASTLLIALLVTASWGINFTIIEIGLEGVPPLLLVALRFTLSAVPVFFIKRPEVSWKLLIWYGLFLGVGQFGLLFSAMKIGAGAGLSSLILQVQAFFTAILAAIFVGEKFRVNNAIGMIVAFGGLALIAVANANAGKDTSMNLPAFFMLILAGLMWASANVVARKMGSVNSLSLVVWSSLVPPLPLFALSLLIEGPVAIGAAFAGMNFASIGSILYLSVISTLLGYGLWNNLIAKNGASTVAPFSLMVPIFGVSSAALFLGERFEPLHLVAAGCVLSGLVVHVFGGKIAGLFKKA